MKATGVVRRIDDLGRIVIPKELRRTLKIRDGEYLEIYVEDENVILKRYSSFSDIKNVCDRIVSSINLDDKIIVIIDTENASKVLVTFFFPTEREGQRLKAHSGSGRIVNFALEQRPWKVK